MDSKLRRIAILSSLAAIVLVALLVVYANMQGENKNKIPAGTKTNQSQAGQASGVQNKEQQDKSQDGRIGNDL